METAIRLLESKGIKPSLQRIMVMKYLYEHRTHPTVDEIYNNLHETMPTLSKTTIYNTLTLFEKAGAIQAITIDNNNLRFDADINVHAHFRCKRCNRIFDLEIDNIEASIPSGFRVDESHVYFMGICNNCNEDN